MSQRLLQSICGFAGKEKAAKAAEKAAAAKYQILSSFFVYLCQVDSSIRVFAYLCQVYLSICGFPGAKRKQWRSS